MKETVDGALAAEFMRTLRGFDESLGFVRAFFFAVIRFRKNTSVQFDELGADLSGGFHLRQIGSDEETYFDSGVCQAASGFT